MVYLASCSEANAQSEIETIPMTLPSELHFLSLALDDRATAKPVVEAFKARETKLDILLYKVGIALPSLGSISAQGHELQMATTCLGYSLLTQLLFPFLL